MKTFGFPKSRRLAKQCEFRQLYQTGQKKSNRYLTIYACPVQGRWGKVGIVAGKRLGKAVERNKIRRKIREIIRTYPEIIGKNQDLAIVVKSPALELSRRELAEQLLRLLGKSEALHA
jgi:ribonuclease P protein component